MTFNGAFPSSPLSRSAIQGESGGAKVGRRHPPSSPSSYYQDNNGSGPSNLTKSRLVGNRRASEGVPRTLVSSQTQAMGHYPTTSTRPQMLSTSPPRTPPTRSPDSLMTPLPQASSPHSYYRRSPIQRSASSSASRRRLSEQSFVGSGGLLHHSPGPSFGSFVGSYEESLLSGRMSSLPSKPLVFDAELGVLGLGKCKASLRCPPHVNFTFPAHFYSLEGATEKEKGTSSLGTPYVGTIDVEGYYLDALLASQMGALSIPRGVSGLGIDAQGSSKAIPVNGSFSSKDTHSFPGYRIPPKGQIQLVIKNPNLTAVKLFLIPYDFTDMPAGTKTFIRQKSHVISPGPGTEAAVRGGSSSSPSPWPSPSPSPSPSHRSQGRTSAGRETLRYAVHLHFCALPLPRSAKSRQSEPGFTAGGLDRLHHRNRKSDQNDLKPKKQSAMIYLHKNIRVVFAARVPDSTEKLRIVTETPGGSEENRENIYSTFHGPSEEWKEAKRVRRASDLNGTEQLAAAQRTILDEERGVEEEQLQEGEDTFNTVIINSDPNGERWFGENSSGGGPSTPDGVDIPLTARSSWLEQTEEQRRHQDSQEVPTSLRSIAPSAATNFPSVAFDDGNRPDLVPLHTRQRSLSSEATERVEDDRAMLEQWHASLASRPHSIRPASPATSSFRNRPVSPPLARRSISPTSGIHPLMHRSTSSNGGVSSGSSGHGHGGQAAAAPTSPSRGSSVAWQGVLRPLTPQRTGDGFGAAPHGPFPFARPIQASLDLDHASGIMEQQQINSIDSTFTSSRRPSLMRKLSSQSQLNPSISGRSSPAVPPSQRPLSPKQ